MEVQDNLFPKLILVEGAPVVAAAGTLALYAKVDGKVYAVNDAGLEILLGASDLTAIMAMLTAAATHDFTTDANENLIAAEYNSSVLKAADTGTLLTTGRDLIFPGAFSPKLFTNTTAKALTVKKAGQVGVSVPAGDTVLVFSGVSDVKVFSAGGAVLDQTGIATPVRTEAVSYTAALGDFVVEMNVATANNFTVPTNATVAFPIGYVLEPWQAGAGQTTIVPAAGVTIKKDVADTLKLKGLDAGCALRKVATNTWRLIGKMEPV